MFFLLDADEQDYFVRAVRATGGACLRKREGGGKVQMTSLS